NLVGETSTNPKGRNRRRSKQRIKSFSLEETPVVKMSDQRTMVELLQAPTEGYRDAIVIPAILAENFKLKHGLLNLVTSKQFYGFEKEDPHPGFGLKKNPLALFLLGKILFPSLLTNSFLFQKLQISRMKLRIFSNVLMNHFVKHGTVSRISFVHAHITGFTKLHQLDTFYNALTATDQDSLNAIVGGNLLIRTPRDALKVIANKSEVCNLRNKPVVTKVSTNAPSSFTPHFFEIAALANAVKAMLRKKSSPPSYVKAVEEICVTCGSPHPYHQCLATDSNVFLEYQDNIQGDVSAAAVNYNQGNTGYRP
nr:hypothetical protein [Tanacetum cinerariifolium]